MILFLAANPSDTSRLTLDREARSIHVELKRTGYRDRFDFVTRWAAEPLDLLRELRELKPTIVHFSGHGAGPATTTDRAHGRDSVAATSSADEPGGMMFDGGDGRVQLVTPEAFAQTLDAAGASVRLVVLNACYTASIAQALLAHVDCVVGMNGSIQDDTARSFAIGFYGGLGEHESIAAAFEQGKAAINLEGLTDAEQPRLQVRDAFDATQLILAAVPPALRQELLCPYPGMRPYAAEDAAGFHGRDKEINELLGRLRAGEREIYVIGPSGSGKSSLVAAGVLPRLARGVAGVGSFVVRDLRPGEQPAARLYQALEVSSGQPFVAADRLAALLAHRGSGSSVLILVDQLEELFTLASARERELFLAALRSLRVERHCVVIFTLRADFFGALMESPLWGEHRGQLSRIEVSPLCGEALREAISAPARNVGVVVEPELVERLLADAASEPGILPLLQETMVELWDQRVDQTLRLSDYQALGDGDRNGLAVALARRADAALRRFTPAQTRIARRILLRLITFGEGRADTRRQQPRSKLRTVDDDAADFTQVLQWLVGYRLLTIDEDDTSGEPRVDLGHEIVIVAWPSLAGWIRTHGVDELRRRQLEVAANSWMERGSGVSSLLDPIELAEVEEWRRTAPARDLGESLALTEFISASKHARDRQRRWRFVQGAIIGVLAAVALLAVGLLIVNYRRTARAHVLTNIGEIELEIQAFDWDATNLRATTVLTPEEWRSFFYDWNDVVTSAPFPEQLITRRIPQRVGAAIVEDIDIRGGLAYVVVERMGCSASSIPLQLPGYDPKHMRNRIVLRVPTCAVSFQDMIRIPAGPFIYGGRGDPPANEISNVPNESVVDLPEFAIDRTEVSNVAFDVFVGTLESGRVGLQRNPQRRWLSRENGIRKPVSNVTWFEARAYCRFLGKDLPTSHEWMKALRGGLQLEGNANPSPRRNFPQLAHPVPREMKFQGAAEIGADLYDISPYGVHDMTGNVEEWTLTDIVTDLGVRRSQLSAYIPQPHSDLKITQGGSWNLPMPLIIETMASGNIRQNSEYNNALGIRCASHLTPTLVNRPL